MDKFIWFIVGCIAGYVASGYFEGLSETKKSTGHSEVQNVL